VEFDKIQLLTLNLNKGLPVPNCTATKIEFPALKRRQIEANFSGGRSPVTAGFYCYAQLAVV